MIQFKTINLDGNTCTWQYNSTEELEKEWRSDNIDMDVPANDDPVFDVIIDGKSIFERIGTNSVWFEDLLIYLGINIWC